MSLIISWTLVNNSTEPLVIKIDGKTDTQCLSGEKCKIEGRDIKISLERYVDQGDGDWCNHTMDDKDLRFYDSKCFCAEHSYPNFKNPERCKTRTKQGNEVWDYYLTFFLDCVHHIIYARTTEGHEITRHISR